MTHYELEPVVWHETPLVFDWDAETGDLSGLDARRVLERAQPGEWVGCHPRPFAHRLGPEPLRSREDMAAILGEWWRLPADLAPFYPRPDPMEEDGVDSDVLALITY